MLTVFMRARTVTSPCRTRAAGFLRGREAGGPLGHADVWVAEQSIEACHAIATGIAAIDRHCHVSRSRRDRRPSQACACRSRPSRALKPPLAPPKETSSFAGGYWLMFRDATIVRAGTARTATDFADIIVLDPSTASFNSTRSQSLRPDECFM
jgi:hypothetical protein